MDKRDEYLSFHKIHTYPIRERENMSKIAGFAKGIPKKGIGFKEYLEGLPNTLPERDIREAAKAIVAARKRNKPVIFCLGAGIIRCGLSPIIISLMEKGIVTAVALDGAGSIHDFEIALIGETSEDPAAGLEDGTYGMVEETGRMMNETLQQGVRQGIGAGSALGERILREDFSYRDYSILAKGIELGIPVTVHIAIGTDVIHQHPAADGAALGEASFIDFQAFSTHVSRLGDGGVMANLGADGILPEVFLRALTISRNLGYQAKNFIIIDLDVSGNCRPYTTAGLGEKIYSIVGAHEITMPMLAQAVVEYGEVKV